VASTTLNIPHPYEDGMAEAWMETHAPQWEARERLALAVTTEEDGLIGGISLHLAAAHRRGELGYWIAVPYWNLGYATEAAKALIDYGFEELDLNRVVAQHITRNPASGRVLQKLGMSPEGVRRQHVLKWGRFEDLEMYAVLREDRKGS
jgi:RimJ/RimL family protein N-acetyltransferase